MAILCAICRSPVALYQKDGRPNQDLIRLYLDRFVHHPRLSELLNVEKESEMEVLRCQAENSQGEKCGTVIGNPMLYTNHGESRLAYRLVQENVVKTKYIDAVEAQKPKVNRRDRRRAKYSKKN